MLELFNLSLLGKLKNIDHEKTIQNVKKKYHQKNMMSKSIINWKGNSERSLSFGNRRNIRDLIMSRDGTRQNNKVQIDF